MYVKVKRCAVSLLADLFVDGIKVCESVWSHGDGVERRYIRFDGVDVDNERIRPFLFKRSAKVRVAGVHAATSH